MRIKYNILWFEDASAWLGSVQPQIEEYLDGLGFDLNVFPQSDGASLEDLLKRIDTRTFDIDLILMDYQLAGDKDGLSLISKIREHTLYTEIVFYSQHQDVRALAGNLEGVYYAAREDVIDKAKKIIALTIKKAQDLNSLRGLVMAEATDLEGWLFKSIQKFISQGSELQINQRKRELYGRILESREANARDLRKLDPIVDFDKFCSKLSHYDKLSSLNFLMKEAIAGGAQKYKSHLEQLKPYDQEVIKVRNDLAHAQESTDSEGRRILKSLRRGGDPFIFSEGSCISIRKCLRIHKTTLEALHGA